MKNLIKHLLKENEEEIVAKSLFNCHIVGLHSIMLYECPGKTIRMFICDENHELFENSLAIHPHHCNITLHQIYGQMTNVIYYRDKSGEEYAKFKYTSGILEKEMKIEYIAEAKLKKVSERTLFPNFSISLSAQELHTVYCKKGEISAWLVYEGKEDINYDSVLYSKKWNIELDDRLYKKMTIEQITKLLAKII